MPSYAATLFGQVIQGVELFDEGTGDTTQKERARCKLQFYASLPDGAGRTVGVVVLGARFFSVGIRMIGSAHPPVIEMQKPHAHTLASLDDGCLVHDMRPVLLRSVRQSTGASRASLPLAI